MTRRTLSSPEGRSPAGLARIYDCGEQNQPGAASPRSCPHGPLRFSLRAFCVSTNIQYSHSVVLE